MQHTPYHTIINYTYIVHFARRINLGYQHSTKISHNEGVESHYDRLRSQADSTLLLYGFYGEQPNASADVPRVVPDCVAVSGEAHRLSGMCGTTIATLF